MGAIVLTGWVTKVTEYSKAKVIKQKINVTMMMTKALTRTSISSAVNRGLLLSRILSRKSFNFFLQNRGYKVFRAILVEFASWLLTSCLRKMIWILAKISIAVFAPCQKQDCRQKNQGFYHVYSSRLPVLIFQPFQPAL